MTKILFSFFFFLFSFCILSQEDLGTIDVIGSSPLPGIMIDRKDVPQTTQKITDIEIKQNLTKTIADLMNESFSGISVKDVQNGAFQKNVDYRGFTASPLLGESQGLSVYLDGVRINESFGDTVQWELVPENAIKQIDLMSSNPAFGLNALGGSLALTTKKGLDYKNSIFFDTTNKYGSFNFASEVMEYGYGTDTSGMYSSVEIKRDGGWRDHSDGEVNRFFTNYGLERDNYDLSFTFLGGKTDLNGNGVTPIELLQKDREAVFTWPDKTSNTMSLFYGNTNFYTNDDSILSTNFYHKRLYRTTYNADEVDAEECAEDSAADATELKNDYSFDDAPLCGEDNSAGDYGIILDQHGNAIESNDNIRKYGLLNKTFTTTNTLGGAMQYDTFLNIMNKFKLLYSFFIFLSFLLLKINVVNAEYGTEKERKGFKEIDLDDNGKISYYEFQQIRQKRFDRLDLNNDKIITQDEFEARNQKFFIEIDKNKDKSLTKREMFKKRKKLRNIFK